MKFLKGTAILSLLAVSAWAAPQAVQATQAAGAAQSTATKAADKAEKHATKAKAAAVSTVSDQDIADAKAKGLVWANENTKVYHKDGKFYGHTKHGKFMTEADAEKAGYHLAKEGAVAKKATDAAKTVKK